MKSCSNSCGHWLFGSRRRFSNQLGFGLCERSLPPTAVDAAARLRKQAAITGLLRQQAPQPKRAKVDPTSSSSKTPLLDKEKSEKWRWAARLEAIAQRAGHFSRLFREEEQSAELSPGERLQLKQLVLIAGAHCTERWLLTFPPSRGLRSGLV